MTYKSVTVTVPSGARIRDNGQQATMSSLKQGQRVVVLQAPAHDVRDRPHSPHRPKRPVGEQFASHARPRRPATNPASAHQWAEVGLEPVGVKVQKPREHAVLGAMEV